MDTKELSSILKIEWDKRSRSGNAGDVFHMLIDAYSESHRHYHNLQHVGEMLAALPSCSNALYMAVWFHDAVYDPKLKDNEEKSAELAEKKCIGMGYCEEFAADVASLIMATKHVAEPSAEEAKKLCDADLAIFASPRVYDYDAGIRKEYSYIPEEAYLQRRKRLLNGFLAKPCIYHTKEFRDKYEEKARENLKALIQELNNKLLDLDTSIGFGMFGLKD